MTVETHWRRWQARLAAIGERRLVVIEGDRARGLAMVRRILAQLAPEQGLWSGPGEDRPHPALTVVPPHGGRRRLGTETPLLVWDGWQGNPPDSLAAFSGTLAAGGLWFWLMPPLTEWAGFEDPDYQRTGLALAPDHPFARRLSRILSADTSVLRLAADQSIALPPSLPLVCQPDQPAFQISGTPDQRLAIDRVVAVGQGRRRRPLVITADRGRGKSAALGMAAARLLAEGRSVVVTAPAMDAVRALFRHAGMEVGRTDPVTPEAGLALSDGGRLDYYPIDELLRQRPSAELVLVDEAAVIPAPLLKSVLLGWPRVVFATTVHGYEGSGRGFALRFRGVLDRETPQWKEMQLEAPIRWAVTDPLEPLVSRLLMPGQFSEVQREQAVGNTPAARIELWKPASASEAELQQAFGLLVNAHYRTTPGDLRQWLDDQGAVTWVARFGGAIVGVLWGTLEGGLPEALAQQVAEGKRRLRGHLLAQSLAHHGGEAEAATLRSLRVVRIAVAAGYRRQQIGQQLVSAARKYAITRELDALGTSYGGEPDLLAFWERCGLNLVRVGIQPETSTGEYAVQMLAGLSGVGDALQQRLSSRFAAHWPTLLPVVWPAMEPGLVLALTAGLPPQALSREDLRELSVFAAGGRGFELALPALKRLTCSDHVARRLLAQEHGPLWVKAVLQNQPWDRLRKAGHVQGRRDGEQALRLLATDLLAELPG